MKLASAAFGMLVAMAACDSADTDARLPPGLASNPSAVQLSALDPGPATRSSIATPYEETEWTVYAGGLLYAQLNCVGCHANGGGAIGPPLTDDEWIYGSAPEQVHATIREGRPLGMPAYAGRISDEQAWLLVAYVRALGGLTPPQLRREPYAHMHGPAVATDAHTASPTSAR